MIIQELLLLLITLQQSYAKNIQKNLKIKKSQGFEDSVGITGKIQLLKDSMR